MATRYAIILAAGKGTRMRSKQYKVLHQVAGKAMVEHVVDTVEQLNINDSVVVVGHGAEKVQLALGERVTYVLQEEQLGTGHAALQAAPHFEGRPGTTIVLYGDTPLITAEIIEKLFDDHERNNNKATVLTTLMDNPHGYGRIIRNSRDEVQGIVEQKDTTEEQARINEINTGVCCFDNERLFDVLKRVKNNNSQGEYYLTDCIALMVEDGDKVGAFITEDSDAMMGINDRVALSEAERIMRRRINEHHMRNGVTIVDPDNTYIHKDVEIGSDTIVYPGSIIKGRTTIGENCTIGPGADITNGTIGNEVTIQHSVFVDSSVADFTTIGPFAYVRPGSEIGKEAKIGNFVELKNAKFGDGSKASHLSYIGDAEVGTNVNIGCGTITVNYDGVKKHTTTIEDDAFIGCNANLIAPVKIGKNAYVAAGSTITKEVPSKALAIGRTKQENKENYAERFLKKKS